MAIVFTWSILGLAAVLVVVGVRALLRWDGPWRWLVLLMLLPLVVTGSRIVVDVRADPTAHNLWPFEVLAAAVVSLILLAVFAIGRTVLSRRVQPEARG